jgi:hypothetical protein
MSVAPLVRRVIVCRKVEVDSAQLGTPYTVKKVLTAIRPPVGGSYPIREDELWLFVQYTDGQGRHEVKLELVRQHLESEEAVLTIDLPPIHMTRGRFFVLNRGYRLTNVAFPAPGVYEFRIRCGENSGTDELRLEDVP